MAQLSHCPNAILIVGMLLFGVGFLAGRLSAAWSVDTVYRIKDGVIAGLMLLVPIVITVGAIYIAYEFAGWYRVAGIVVAILVPVGTIALAYMAVAEFVRNLPNYIAELVLAMFGQR
jgi:Na+/H+-translocating membrane pyrophosphatase